MTERHDFNVGQLVQFTEGAKSLFDNNPEHNGTFVIAEISSVPTTCLDPLSPNYMGGQEGQNAVGHHQSVRLEGCEGWVSGALLESAGEISVLPIGTVVVYFNLWTGFETEEFRDQFPQLTRSEITALKEGDEVYVDLELHPSGKVYGFVKVKIVNVVPIDGGEFQVYFQGGGWQGFKTTKDGVCFDISRANDETTLAAIIARLPLSTQIDPQSALT